MGHQLLPHIYAPDSPGRDKIEQQKIIDHHAFDHMIRFNQVKAEDLDVPEHTKTAQSSKSWLQLLLYAVAGSLLLLGLFVLWNVRDWCMTGLSVSVGHIERMVKTTGPWAVVWCAAALTVAVVLAIPLSVMEALLGHLFPFWTALFICCVGKSAGGSVCFGIGRTFGSGIAERFVSKSPRLRSLRTVILRNPLRLTLLLRFTYLPGIVKNYGWSVMGVGFHTFLLACMIEAPFYAVPMVLIGSKADSIADIVSGKRPPSPEAALFVALGIALIFAFVALTYVLEREASRSCDADASRAGFEDSCRRNAACASPDSPVRAPLSGGSFSSPLSEPNSPELLPV